MRGFVTYLAAVCLAVFCLSSAAGSRPRTVQQSPRGDIAEFDSANMATFYYTEALKKEFVHDSLDAALRLLELAIGADSCHAPSYYEAANIFIALGDIASAERFGSRAYELDSLNIWYKNQRGRLYIQTEQYYRALQIYRDIVRQDPFNPEAYRLLAALYVQEQMPLAAIELLDSAQMKTGRVEELSEMKRELLVQTGQTERAITETEEHLADFPADEGAYIVLADMYAISQRDSMQLHTLERLLAENPGSVNGLLALAEYHRRRNDAQAFMQTMQRLFDNESFPVEDKLLILEQLTSDRNFYRDFYPQMNSLIMSLADRYPEHSGVTDAYARHQIAIGQIEHALLIYKSQIEKGSATADIFSSVLDIETYLQRPDSVRKYSETALQQLDDGSPAYYGIMLSLGSAQLYMEQTRQAKATFTRGLKKAPADSLKSVFAGALGDLMYRAGKMRKAFAYYDQALRLDADNALVLNNYAYFLSERSERLEMALEMAVRANDLAGGNSTYLDTQAWVLHKLGRNAEAKKIMQQALSLDRSGSAVLLVHYGDILNALGQRFMAETYWKRALQAGFDSDQIEKRLEADQ